MKNIYTIHPIPLFRFEIPKPRMMYLHGFGENISLICYMWLIKGPGGNILVDSGGSVDIMKSKYPVVEPLQTFESAFSAINLTPDDINIVIQTHLHHDHAAFLRRFRKARIIVQSKELEFAQNPHIFFSEIYHRDMFDGVKFETIAGDEEILNGIKVIRTPGHTPGGQSVAIETAAGTAVITGFCCTLENFEPPAEIREKIPLIPSGIHINAIEAYESALRVKKLAVILIPLHEPKFLKIEVI